MKTELPMEKSVMDYLKSIDAFILRSEKERKLMLAAQRGVLKKARAILAAMHKKELKTLQRLDQRFQDQSSVLENFLNVAKNCDETLCNVLLAIRQNEYLQAYYPAQNGQKDQMVVGKYVVEKNRGAG